MSFVLALYSQCIEFLMIFGYQLFRGAFPALVGAHGLNIHRQTGQEE
jgi:hypothetical protein